jgi:hypothetical protein
MWLSTLLWLAPVALQSCLAALIVRRRVYRQYPIFFAYTIFAILAEVTRFSLYHPGRNTWPYFWAVWGGEALYAFLGFLAIFEVFRHVFAAFNHFAWFKFLLPVTGAIMICISVLIPIAHPSVDTVRLLDGIFFLQIAVRCLQLGVFFLIFFLARLFDLDYRQYAFGIAAGFGIAAAGILLGTLVRTGGGLKFLIFFQYAQSVSYFLAVVVWLASFVRPEPDDPFRDFRHLFTPESFLAELQRYKQEVKGIFRP